MRLKFLFFIFLAITVVDINTVFSKNYVKQKKVSVLKKTKKHQVDFSTDALSEDPSFSIGATHAKNTPSTQSQKVEEKDSFARQTGKAIIKTIVYIDKNKTKIAIIGGVTIVATLSIAYLVDPTSTTAAMGWIIQKAQNWLITPQQTVEDVMGKIEKGHKVGDIINRSLNSISEKILPTSP